MKDGTSALVSIILSIIATLVAGFSLYESHMQRMSATTDVYSLTVTLPQNYDSVVFDPARFSERLSIVNIPVYAVVSNTGASTISVVDFGMDYVQPSGANVYYSGIVGGFFDIETEKNRYLPFIVEPGKTIVVKIVVGINIGPRAASIVKSRAGTRKTLYFGEMRDILAKEHSDLFDNRVNPVMAEGRVVGWSVEDMSKTPTYTMRMRTSRGVTEYAGIPWYPKFNL